jgi:GNAT superfamily N-acetyltransferase
LAHYPEYGRAILIDGEILGYLAGMPWSHDPNLYALQPHMKLFSQNYVNYPAHLHINFTHKARGQGLGRLLVESFMQQLVTLGQPGVHIMTGPDSENRFFYRKLGFHFELEKEGILFMGMSFNRL